MDGYFFCQGGYSERMELGWSGVYNEQVFMVYKSKSPWSNAILSDVKFILLRVTGVSLLCDFAIPCCDHIPEIAAVLNVRKPQGKDRNL
jgi:hypothetical protein